jgi:hypothetical protein
MMVSEIEELCQFGQRFDVLQINSNEIYYWLRMLKEGLHKAVQYSHPDLETLNRS